ncbi:hypothetical protein I302_107826 [Kwoniella bestiolae CBS 10118]|uniref:Uncharacterized protein n=1 Tax=Kwoniella bestiolae CBS 10118 TaxID=1296100 RepID=A0A1B9FXF9_9TREE|nr:hypothetical protein I302_06434 [Kwoniella bestiolae CBS 10118]OCF23452.1 hypothetical protein I302_06434 [Kwoniella bestiolae CBS 10118]
MPFHNISSKKFTNPRGSISIYPYMAHPPKPSVDGTDAEHDDGGDWTYKYRLERDTTSFLRWFIDPLYDTEKTVRETLDDVLQQCNSTDYSGLGSSERPREDQLSSTPFDTCGIPTAGKKKKNQAEVTLQAIWEFERCLLARLCSRQDEIDAENTVVNVYLDHLAEDEVVNLRNNATRTSRHRTWLKSVVSCRER